MQSVIQKLQPRLKSPVSITLILLTLVLLVCEYNFRWKNDQWRYAVHTDAADYYRYLPTVFITHHFDEQVANPVKYFVGTAIMYSPFFAIACLLSLLAGFPVDGFSMFFPVLISLGTLFYLILGLHYVSKFLRYYIAREWVIALLLVSIAFSTTTYYYTINAPGWAHIVAFALLSCLLFHLKKISIVVNSTNIILLMAGSAFLFFVRPTDIIILLLAPFFSANLAAFKQTMLQVFQHKRAIITGFLIALVPLACQLGIYKAYSGLFIIWSYTKEGFDFLHPEIGNVLFSYAKGFFVYTPICFLALFGLFRLLKVNRFLFTGVAIYLVLNIYIISSWWCWNYGYSYGPRAFIEHYPVFFLLLGFLLDVNSKLQKALVITCMGAFTYLNLFQTYQTLNGILDQDFKTDKQGYWDVFLRMDKGYSGKFYRFPVDERSENIVKRVSFYSDLEKKDSTWLNPNSQVTDKAHSGTFASKVNNNNWYSSGLRKYLKEVPYNKNVLIRVSAWFFVPKRGSNSYFAFSFVNNGKAINYSPFALDGYTRHFGEWEQHIFELPMPKFSSKVEQDASTQVEFYYFNNSTLDCYIDDLSIEFIEFKQMNRVLDLSWE